MFGCTGSSLLFGVFSCGERGLLFAVVQALLITVAAPVEEHRLSARGPQCVAPRLSSCGSQALGHGFSSCGTPAWLV